MYRAISAILRSCSVRTERSVSSLRDLSPLLLCLCLLVLPCGAVSAQTPLPSAAKGSVAPVDLMQGNPSEEALRKFRAAHQELLAKHQRAARSASARGAIGRTTVVALCIDSFVVNGTHHASAADVKIVSAQPRDCDGDRCRIYEVTATRDSTQPFDIEVSVTCS